VRNDFRADVVVVQQRLNALGYGPLVEDGHYGPLTEVAVRRFQVDQGLAVDGVVGAVTWGALFG
jgi:peptidoglycan hydrolase-like protein with peptidoglycan-binding domain